MKLSGPQLKQLQEVLLAAFIDQNSLKQMVRFGLDENLDAIAPGKTNLSEIVFDLLLWAESKGRIEELVRAASETSPNIMEELGELYEALLTEIPFVIASMTRAQAESMLTRPVCDDTNQMIDFDNFLKIFYNFLETLRPHMSNEHSEIHSSKDILDCYGALHEEWSPLFCESKISIKDIIISAMQHVNFYREANGYSKVVPRFASDEFFDPKRAPDIVRFFQNRGGVLIVDALSMFHPDISEAVAKSEITSRPEVAILVVSPIDAAGLKVNSEIENALHTVHPQAHQRFHTEFDRTCEIDLGNVRSLNRWLVNTIPDTARFVSTHHHVPNSRKRKQMQDTVNDATSTGIHRVFWGRSTKQ